MVTCGGECLEENTGTVPGGCYMDGVQAYRPGTGTKDSHSFSLYTARIKVWDLFRSSQRGARLASVD